MERGPAGEQIAYVRTFCGAVRVRDRLHRKGSQRKVTAIGVFERGDVVRRLSLSAGQIGKLWGLGGIQIGDAIGRSEPPLDCSFAPPTLETVVVPDRLAERGSLHVALAHLAEQDPLIDFRLDDDRHEVSVSLYGEVQKEIIQATLAADFGIDVTFLPTTTICIERPVCTLAALEIMSAETNPFLGTVGLRVDPAPIDTGVGFRLGAELGSMPFAFFAAVEDSVRKALQHGNFGCQVTDCTVTMTHFGDYPRSTAGDFRNLTPLVLMRPLRMACTQVYEPIHRFRLEFPSDRLGTILPVLARLRGIPRTQAVRGSSVLLEGHLPAALVHELTKALPGLTHGEVVPESAFDRCQAALGAVPARPRSDR